MQGNPNSNAFIDQINGGVDDKSNPFKSNMYEASLIDGDNKLNPFVLLGGNQFDSKNNFGAENENPFKKGLEDFMTKLSYESKTGTSISK